MFFSPDRTIPVDRIILADNHVNTGNAEELAQLAVHSRQFKITAAADKPLVLFVGGARDFYHRAVFYGLFTHYLAKNAEKYQLAYATHSANNGIVALLKRWQQAQQKIYLVGHSWGGSRCLKVINKEAKQIPIECLLTLDPVSRLTKGRNYPHPENVKLWANSYIDYPRVGLNIPNIVAIIGGHWMYCPAADYNYAVSHYRGKEVDHMNAYVLFKKIKRFIPDFH